MPAAANVNTGKKDTKGRTIFKGPRGGLFVRVNGKKQKPATGRAAPAARSPARSPARAPAATGNVNTGQVDGKGRTIFRGPRGGLFVRANGKKQKPAAPVARSPARSPGIEISPAALGTPKIFGRKKTGRFLNPAGVAAVLATYPPELQCPPGKVYNPRSEYDPRAKRCITLSSSFGQEILLKWAKGIEQERHRGM
jgi:hypothetical protein